MFIARNSDTGKSALVRELYKRVTQNKGIFICGKYAFSFVKPCLALLEAVDSFCDNLLLKDKATKMRYKNKILDAVIDEGKLLADIVPNFHLAALHVQHM